MVVFPGDFIPLAWLSLSLRSSSVLFAASFDADFLKKGRPDEFLRMFSATFLALGSFFLLESSNALEGLQE